MSLWSATMTRDFFAFRLLFRPYAEWDSPQQKSTLPNMYP